MLAALKIDSVDCVSDDQAKLASPRIAITCKTARTIAGEAGMVRLRRSSRLTSPEVAEDEDFPVPWTRTMAMPISTAVATQITTRADNVPTRAPVAAGGHLTHSEAELE